MFIQPKKPRDTSLLVIVAFVIIAHGAALLLLNSQKNITPIQPPKEHIIVKTVQLGETRTSSKTKKNGSGTQAPSPRTCRRRI